MRHDDRQRACRRAGEDRLTLRTVERHTSRLGIVHRIREAGRDRVETAADRCQFGQRERGASKTSRPGADRLAIDSEAERSIGSHCGRQGLRRASLHKALGRIGSERDGNGPVAFEIRGNGSEARQPFQQLIALVEQGCPIAAARTRARQAQVHASQFSADDVGFGYLRVGFEPQALAHCVETGRRDVELACERCRFADDRSPPRRVDRIASKLLQRCFEFYDGGKDARLFERALHIAQTLQFGIRALQITRCAANFALQKGIRIAANFRNART